MQISLGLTTNNPRGVVLRKMSKTCKFRLVLPRMTLGELSMRKMWKTCKFRLVFTTDKDYTLNNNFARKSFQLGDGGGLKNELSPLNLVSRARPLQTESFLGQSNIWDVKMGHKYSRVHENIRVFYFLTPGQILGEGAQFAPKRRWRDIST